MSSSQRFQFFLDLISNVGTRSQSDARLIEQSQRRMAEAVDRTSGRVSNLERTMDSLSRNTSTERQITFMDSLARRIDQVNVKAQALRKTMAEGIERAPEFVAGAVAGGYAAKKIGSAPLRAYSTLEDATSDLRIAMLRSNGNVGTDFNKIMSQAVMLGNKLPGATKDFVASAVELISQGVPASVVANGGLRSAGGYGVLSRMNQAEAAKTVAKMREAYGLKDEELPAMADLMQRARYGFGIDPMDFKEVAKYAAPVFNTMKLTGLDRTKQLLAVQGLGASIGLESSSFGTNFSMMLSRLGEVDSRLARKSPEAKEAKEVLDKYGITMSFYNKDRSFAGIENMLAQLQKLRALPELDQQHVLTRMFGQEAGRPAQLLVQKGLEGYREAMQRIDDQASLDQRLELRTSTLTSVVDAVTGSFENLLAAVGKTPGEMAKPVLNKLNDWTGSMTDWANDNPYSATALLGGVTAGGVYGGVKAKGALWRAIAGRLGGSAGAVPELVFPTLEGAAAPASRLSGAARVLGRYAPWLGGALGTWSVLSDDNLTTMGKARGLGEVGAGTAGGYGGWAGGAALGTMVAAGPGTLIGGLLGGLAGGFGASKLYDWLMPTTPGRDVLSITAPNGALVSGNAATGAQIQVGEGRLQVDVHVTDDRVSASSSVLASPPLLRLDPGSTDPGSFAAVAGGF